MPNEELKPNISNYQLLPINSTSPVYTEFLKAAFMQSHDCAKYLRICATFGLMNAKQENRHYFHVFDTT